MRRTTLHAAALAALLLSLGASAPATRAQKSQPPDAKPPGLERYAPRDSSDDLYDGWETRCADASTRHIVAGEKNYKAGRYAEAVAEFGQAVAKSPDGVIANYFLGVAYEKTGRFEDAVAPYGKVPVDNAYGVMIAVFARRNLANVYTALGRAEEAVAADELVAKLFLGNKKLSEGYDGAREVDAKIHYNLGLSYAAAGRAEQARRAFARAAEMKPDYAEAQYNLGVAHLDGGDRAAAEAKVKTLKALAPALAERLKLLLR